MMHTRDGLPLTVGEPAGAVALDRAVESYLGARADTPRLLARAVNADPDHLMARCMMAYLHKLAEDPANSASAAAIHGALGRRLAGGDATAWERAHVTALGMWLADDLHSLMAHFERLVEAYPADLLALRMLHYLYFYDGDARRMRDSVAARLPHFAGHPLEGYLQGMYAFGLEEAGDLERAERFGRGAVAANPRDLWAAHAVAHVMHMQGRSSEGAAWLDRLRGGWRDANNFRFHLYWHQALFHLAGDDHDRALATYDDEVSAAVSDDFYLDVCNAASLLLRLEARGVDVGERWQPLAEIAEGHVRDSELVFASLHYLIPLLKTGSPAAGTLLSTLENWAATGTTQGNVARDVALDVARFLVASCAGDHARARHLHDAFRRDLHRIGGSHAQRELFHIAAREADEPRAENGETT